MFRFLLLVVLCVSGCKFHNGMSSPADPSGEVQETPPGLGSLPGGVFASAPEERALSIEEALELDRKVKEYEKQIEELKNTPPKVVESIVEKPVPDPKTEQALQETKEELARKQEEFNADMQKLKDEMQAIKEERDELAKDDATKDSSANPPPADRPNPTPPHDVVQASPDPAGGIGTDVNAPPVFTVNGDSFRTLALKSWNIQMITSDHCINCNQDEIVRGAEKDGMTLRLTVTEANDEQTLAKYGVKGTPAYLFKLGDQIVDRRVGRMSWEAVKRNYLEVAYKGVPQSVAKVMQAQPVEAIPLGEINIKQQVQKAIDVLRPMLDGGATIMFSYNKTGVKSLVVKPFGVPVTLGAETKLTMAMQGDDIMVSISPPVYASLGGFPLPGIKALKLNPDGTTVDLKWIPSFVEPKVIFK